MVKLRKKTIKKTETYTIHKATLISYDATASCTMFKKVFGDSVSGCLDPPDDGLKKRGIKWVKFKRGGKCEFHFVPPFKLTDERRLKNLIDKQMTIDPLETQLFENHVGMYVPDLTNIIINILKLKIPCHLNKRADGMYQFYFPIVGCLDYLDIDSKKINFEKINKVDPDFRAYSFIENTNLVHKYEAEFVKKTKKRRRRKNKANKTRLYLDPEHDNAPRRITFHKNKEIQITGKDTRRGKIWKIKGKLDKNNNAILDFSSKGGPKAIKAKINKDAVVFGDGNKWKSVYKIN